MRRYVNVPLRPNAGRSSLSKPTSHSCVTGAFSSGATRFTATRGFFGSKPL